MTVDAGLNAHTPSTPVGSHAVWDDPHADAPPPEGADGSNDIGQATRSTDAGPLQLASVAPATAVPIDGSGTNSGEGTTGATPDGKTIEISPLHVGNEATVARELTRGDGYYTNDQLVFTTNGSGNDQVQVSQRDDGTVDVSVNGETYEVALAQGQELTLRVGAGEDVVEVAPNVRVNIVVDGGDGDDDITLQGSGNSRIDGGDGDDHVDLSASSGRNDVFGNTGNDGIVGGNGADVLYGGDGNDVIDGGDGTNYLEGGKGDDEFDAATGKNMVSGGQGDDGIVSGSTQGNSVYLGAGDDTVDGVTGGDKVYAESVDAVNFAAGQSDTGQVVVNVEIDPSLGSSIAIEGSDAFRQRVEADLEFLRNSPVGQKMLAAIDSADPALRNPDSDHTVVIRELAREENGYASPAAEGVTYGDVQISNGQPGQGTQTFMNYNPSFSMDAFPAPIVVLQHELAHDYNFATGTMFAGTYRGDAPDSGRVPNSERQAVGLPTSDPDGYNFDGDGTEEALFTNPDFLTENGMRTELGLPLRESYVLQSQAQAGTEGEQPGLQPMYRYY